jgi:hypothetical protein
VSVLRVDDNWLKSYQAKRGKDVPVKKVSPVLQAFRSKWEKHYAHELELRKAAKDIKDWEYETVKIRLCDWQWEGKRRTGRTYTPDFKITHNDGSIELVEVKGYGREDAILKYQWAVKDNPQYTWTMVTYEKRRLVVLHHQKGININVTT